MMVEFFFAVEFKGAIATLLKMIVAFVTIVVCIQIVIEWMLLHISNGKRIVESFSDWTDFVCLDRPWTPPREPPDKPSNLITSNVRTLFDC